MLIPAVGLLPSSSDFRVISMATTCYIANNHRNPDTTEIEVWLIHTITNTSYLLNTVQCLWCDWMRNWAMKLLPVYHEPDLWVTSQPGSEWGPGSHDYDSLVSEWRNRIVSQYVTHPAILRVHYYSARNKHLYWATALRSRYLARWFDVILSNLHSA